MTNFYKNKKVCVTGSQGMIGKELCELLEKQGARVFKVDIKNGTNLIYPNNAISVCIGMDYVFHLAGVKGNPKMTKERPCDFMIPMLQFDTNMIHASQACKVKRFLYTSSIAVENPETDKYPAWAKKTGETLIDAMRIQYPKGTKFCIVRPANVYGKYDNFDNPNAMVVTKLIKQVSETHKIELLNGGINIRDFINAKDVALGMMKAMEEMPGFPVNLCSGEGVTIGMVAALIGKELGATITHTKSAEFMGDDKRVMRRNWNNPLTVSLEKGIKEVCEFVRTKNA